MGEMHRHLLTVVRELPEDYDPWGTNTRWADPNKAYPDCSSGCKHALWLEDLPGQPISMDWCVCSNPKSHRAGLLTFEHQGCQQYEYEGDPESDEEERKPPPAPKGRRASGGGDPSNNAAVSCAGRATEGESEG